MTDFATVEPNESLPQYADAGRAQILLAVPDARRRDAYTSMLRDAGFDVTTATDDETAVAAARQSLSAVVTTYLTATSGGDLAMCRQLCAATRPRDVPVIVLTGLDDEQTREQIVRAGATAIMIEPLKQGLLVRRIRRLLAHVARRKRSG